ncbi:MAG: anhydro-N-acetylmuramic acid kinase [Planktomarina sp.]
MGTGLAGEGHMALHEPIWIAGCMSGTSMDGVDVAMLRTDGVQIYEFGRTAYRAFTDAERAVINHAQGQWHDGPDVAAAAKVVEDAHIEVLSDFPEAQMIGFHGQTLAHDPAGKGTHQAGDGAVLSSNLNRPVVWDFRTADVTLGGQGAPLAPVYHAALVRWVGIAAPVMVLNLGGVGNLTWIDPSAPDDLLAFDTGPANAPLDDLMQTRLGQGYDKDAKIARAGTIDQAMVDQILALPYFQQLPPKSLDRNSFADALNSIRHLSTEDAAAILTEVMVASVIKALDHLPSDPSQIWVCGGGRQNPLVMERLTSAAPCTVQNIDEFNIDGDMVEAQAFAFLAARVKAGLPTSFSGTTGVVMSVGGGTISG